MMLIAEEGRRESSQKVMDHCFELRSITDKLTDRLEVLERAEEMPPGPVEPCEQMTIKRSVSLKPRMMDDQDYPTWKRKEDRTREKPSHGMSLISQLMKRPPAK